MTLDQLKEGQKARILKIRGSGKFRHRLTEMGFVCGVEIETLRFAPLKDPVEFRLLSCEVSIRLGEAKRIEIELVETNKNSEQNSNSSVFTPKDLYKNIGPDENCFAQNSGNEERIDVCMVGNPNAGKTSLYNNLSGAYERVANYSGVTVEGKSIEFKKDNFVFELTDLPGSYSFSPYSPEEKYVREEILYRQPDVIVNVVDASNIERNLYLTSQLIDMDFKVVLALNMFDEMIKQGAKLDIEYLSTLLGMPIVPTVASSKRGSKLLLKKIEEVFQDKESHQRNIKIPYNIEIEEAISNIEKALKEDESYSNAYSSRFVAIKLLEEDSEVLEQLHCISNFGAVRNLAQKEIKKISSIYGEPPAHLMSDARYAFVRGALKETYVPAPKPSKQKTVTEKIDSVLTHKIWGFPIFLCFLWLMFQCVFSVGQYPMDWIDSGIEYLCATLETSMPDGILKDLILDGITRGIGGVIVFLPNILILFFFISLLETTGYMARVAFIMDRLMHLIGLHGKSFIPMIMGFGCNVPAIMATRTIENRKDRLITMLIIPFMSCSARLPIYIMLVGCFFPKHAGSVIFLIYMLGILFSVLSAILFRKTLLPNEDSPFVMEIPPYRIPTLNGVLMPLWLKTKEYIKKIGGVILIASIIIWALGYFPRGGVGLEPSLAATRGTGAMVGAEVAADALAETGDDAERANLENSYLGAIGKAIEPILKPIGLDWRMGLSLLVGISAKEVVVSTISVLMDVKTTFTPLSAAVFICFVLLYLPCIASFSAVKKESESWKWPIFMAVYSTALAYLLSLLVYNIGSLFC